MNKKRIFEYLLELAERMGIRVVHGKGDFAGGGCRVQEDRVIVINKIKPLEYQARTIVEGLTNFNLSEHYLIPAVRTYIVEDLNINI